MEKNDVVLNKLNRIKYAAKFNNKCDRIPVGEFFWTGFKSKCIEKWGEDFDPYLFFDLDYIPITPNMDPHIKSFEVIEQNGEDIYIRTGFEAIIHRSGDIVMPHYDSFSIKEPEEMAEFTFDDPTDKRRFNNASDDQINGVGDILLRNIPAWSERVDAYVDKLPVFGSVCEGYEYVWRIVGTENSLMWMLAEPELFEAFMKRVGSFLVDFTKAQIKEGKGRLSGMIIWGDVAYRNGMLFSPEAWRKYFKPITKKLIEICHANDLPVIYHGCGNASAIYNDMIELGLDFYNPLEAKADLDVVELEKEYRGRLGFCGNIDMRIFEKNNLDEIKREVLYKMQAAETGGWIFQSDHSISNDVEPESYYHALEVVREYGEYPLDLDKIKTEIARLAEKINSN
ncbi:uroporphyrinogen decarboxylase family protein [Vallitalea sediminicola]